MRREEKMREARDWFGKNFKPKTGADISQLAPPGSQESAYYRMVVTYWEMVASFITAGVLNEELFFQSGMELLFVWVRIGHLVPRMREFNNNPAHLRNLEIVAGNMIKLMERNGPETYQAFVARVGG